MYQTALGLVIPVADQQTGWSITSIQSHSMSRVELFQAVTLGAEVHQVFAGFVELENMVAGITIGEKNVAVGGHGHRSWAELLQVQA